MSLLKHGGMLFAATVVAAFLGYLYHLLMGRMLGPAGYGALASLFAFIYIFATPTGLSGAIQLTAASEIARLKAKGQQKELLAFAQYFSRNVFLLSIAVLLAFLFFSLLVASFLHIEVMSVIALAFLLFFYLILVIPWSLLQGLKRFATYSISNFLMALLKLIVAIGLVFFGFGIGGAISGVTVGVAIAALFCLPFLKEFFKKQPLKGVGGMPAFFSWSILLSLFFLMFLINIDILLVKHFFSAEEAGQYSIASLLGKLVYFLAISFASVLLPMVSESMDKKKEFSLLKKGLFYTACFAAVLILGFWFFSGQIVSVFFGKAFAPSAPLLPLFGIAMTLFSFSNILVYFEMALKRSRHVLALALFSIAEGAALWFFHGSLQEVLLIVSLANALLLAVLVLNLFLLKKEFRRRIL